MSKGGGLFRSLFGGRMQGMFGGSSAAAATHAEPENKYTLQYLQDLHHSLMHQRIREDVLAADEEMVDIIKQISELMVYGDKHSESFFDFFAEKSMMKLLVELYKTRSDAVRIQIIQTLSIFFMNIRNDRALFYLLSNNQLNAIMSSGLEGGDEELLSYYASFLKTLSLSLTQNTVHFFINLTVSPPVFPLYTQAVRYFRHSDGMLRTSARTITLQVFQVRDRWVRAFLLHSGSHAFFPEQIADTARDIVLQLHQKVTALASLLVPFSDSYLSTPSTAAVGKERKRAGSAEQTSSEHRQRSYSSKSKGNGKAVAAAAAVGAGALEAGAKAAASARKAKQEGRRLGHQEGELTVGSAPAASSLAESLASAGASPAGRHRRSSSTAGSRHGSARRFSETESEEEESEEEEEEEEEEATSSAGSDGGELAAKEQQRKKTKRRGRQKGRSGTAAGNEKGNADDDDDHDDDEDGEESGEGTFSSNSSSDSEEASIGNRGRSSSSEQEQQDVAAPLSRNSRDRFLSDRLQPQLQQLAAAPGSAAKQRRDSTASHGSAGSTGILRAAGSGGGRSSSHGSFDSASAGGAAESLGLGGPAGMLGRAGSVRSPPGSVITASAGSVRGGGSGRGGAGSRRAAALRYGTSAAAAAAPTPTSSSHRPSHAGGLLGSPSHDDSATAAVLGGGAGGGSGLHELEEGDGMPSQLTSPADKGRYYSFLSANSAQTAAAGGNDPVSSSSMGRGSVYSGSTEGRPGAAVGGGLPAGPPGGSYAAPVRGVAGTAAASTPASQRKGQQGERGAGSKRSSPRNEKSHQAHSHHHHHHQEGEGSRGRGIGSFSEAAAQLALCRLLQHRTEGHMFGLPLSPQQDCSCSCAVAQQSGGAKKKEEEEEEAEASVKRTLYFSSEKHSEAGSGAAAASPRPSNCSCSCHSSGGKASPALSALATSVLFRRVQAILERRAEAARAERKAGMGRVGRAAAAGASSTTVATTAGAADGMPILSGAPLALGVSTAAALSPITSSMSPGIAETGTAFFPLPPLPSPFPGREGFLSGPQRQEEGGTASASTPTAEQQAAVEVGIKQALALAGSGSSGSGSGSAEVASAHGAYLLDSSDSINRTQAAARIPFSPSTLAAADASGAAERQEGGNSLSSEVFSSSTGTFASTSSPRSSPSLRAAHASAAAPEGAAGHPASVQVSGTAAAFTTAAAALAPSFSSSSLAPSKIAFYVCDSDLQQQPLLSDASSCKRLQEDIAELSAELSDLLYYIQDILAIGERESEEHNDQAEDSGAAISLSLRRGHKNTPIRMQDMSRLGAVAGNLVSVSFQPFCERLCEALLGRLVQPLLLFTLALTAASPVLCQKGTWEGAGAAATTERQQQGKERRSSVGLPAFSPHAPLLHQSFSADCAVHAEGLGPSDPSLQSSDSHPDPSPPRPIDPCVALHALSQMTRIISFPGFRLQLLSSLCAGGFTLQGLLAAAGHGFAERQLMRERAQAMAAGGPAAAAALPSCSCAQGEGGRVAAVGSAAAAAAATGGGGPHSSAGPFLGAAGSPVVSTAGSSIIVSDSSLLLGRVKVSEDQAAAGKDVAAGAATAGAGAEAADSGGTGAGIAAFLIEDHLSPLKKEEQQRQQGMQRPETAAVSRGSSSFLQASPASSAEHSRANSSSFQGRGASSFSSAPSAAAAAAPLSSTAAPSTSLPDSSLPLALQQHTEDASAAGAAVSELDSTGVPEEQATRPRRTGEVSLDDFSEGEGEAEGQEVADKSKQEEHGTAAVAAHSGEGQAPAIMPAPLQSSSLPHPKPSLPGLLRPSRDFSFSFCEAILSLQRSEDQALSDGAVLLHTVVADALAAESSKPSFALASLQQQTSTSAAILAAATASSSYLVGTVSRSALTACAPLLAAVSGLFIRCQEEKLLEAAAQQLAVLLRLQKAFQDKGQERKESLLLHDEEAETLEDEVLQGCSLQRFYSDLAGWLLQWHHAVMGQQRKPLRRARKQARTAQEEEGSLLLAEDVLLAEELEEQEAETAEERAGAARGAASADPTSLLRADASSLLQLSRAMLLPFAQVRRTAYVQQLLLGCLRLPLLRRRALKSALSLLAKLCMALPLTEGEGKQGGEEVSVVSSSSSSSSALAAPADGLSSTAAAAAASTAASGPPFFPADLAGDAGLLGHSRLDISDAASAAASLLGSLISRVAQQAQQVDTANALSVLLHACEFYSEAELRKSPVLVTLLKEQQAYLQAQEGASSGSSQRTAQSQSPKAAQAAARVQGLLQALFARVPEPHKLLQNAQVSLVPLPPVPYASLQDLQQLWESGGKGRSSGSGAAGGASASTGADLESQQEQQQQHCLKLLERAIVGSGLNASLAGVQELLRSLLPAEENPPLINRPNTLFHQAGQLLFCMRVLRAVYQQGATQEVFRAAGNLRAMLRPYPAPAAPATAASAAAAGGPTWPPDWSNETLLLDPCLLSIAPPLDSIRVGNVFSLSKLPWLPVTHYPATLSIPFPGIGAALPSAKEDPLFPLAACLSKARRLALVLGQSYLVLAELVVSGGGSGAAGAAAGAGGSSGGGSGAAAGPAGTVSGSGNTGGSRRRTSSSASQYKGGGGGGGAGGGAGERQHGASVQSSEGSTGGGGGAGGGEGAAAAGSRSQKGKAVCVVPLHYSYTYTPSKAPHILDVRTAVKGSLPLSVPLPAASQLASIAVVAARPTGPVAPTICGFTLVLENAEQCARAAAHIEAARNRILKQKMAALQTVGQLPAFGPVLQPL